MLLDTLAMDVSRAFTWVIGGGMVKITYPGMSWKRRHQHPIRSKFRTSQKAIEPSDTAEYPECIDMQRVKKNLKDGGQSV